MKISIIIPTRNRVTFLKRTLETLSENSFFFNEIIIVDSSDDKNLINNINFPKIRKKIKFFRCSPSISKQRNLGINKISKNSKYVMFLDDDISFEKNSLKNMYNFLLKKNDFLGVGFNLMIKNNLNLERIKNNKIFEILKIYHHLPGIVTASETAVIIS